MPNVGNSGDTWAEYRRLVLAELERLDSAISELAKTDSAHDKNLQTVKADLIDRLQKIKDTIDENNRTMIQHIKKELSEQEERDISDLKNETSALRGQYMKLSSEVKIIKAKAALFGFLSGLGIGIVSIIVKIILGD